MLIDIVFLQIPFNHHCSKQMSSEEDKKFVILKDCGHCLICNKRVKISKGSKTSFKAHMMTHGIDIDTKEAQHMRVKAGPMDKYAKSIDQVKVTDLE